MKSEKAWLKNHSFQLFAGVLIAILLFSLLLMNLWQRKESETLDLGDEEARSLMLYSPYIERMKGSKSIDYSLTEETAFSSYAEYQEYGFITDEQIDETSYDDYAFVVVGDTHGPMGAANYAGLLVHKETGLPCGYVMLK